MNSNFTELPQNLPVPLDDGAADHLKGKSLPKITLPSTDGGTVELASLTGRFVIYIYPMTGRPGVPLPDGWDVIPGARGCTPQSCSFRDHHLELNDRGVDVFGLSTQDTEYQREVRDRLHLPFQLLSDRSLQLKSAMHLPTFRVQGLDLYKRLTLIIDTGKIEKVFYPVFPPDKNAEEVLAWLKQHVSTPRSEIQR
jgi:peroxiredoxin